MSVQDWSEEHRNERAMIEMQLASAGIHPSEGEWSIGEDDNRPLVALGRVAIVTEDEDQDLYHGDEGVLTGTCVGGKEFGNIHVAFYFTNDQWDSGQPVDLDQVEFL